MSKIQSYEDSYQGESKNNKPNWKGVRTLPNGNVQDGEFNENGFWNGTYKDQEGNLISNVIEGHHYY